MAPCSGTIERQSLLKAASAFESESTVIPEWPLERMLQRSANSIRVWALTEQGRRVVQPVVLVHGPQTAKK